MAARTHHEACRRSSACAAVIIGLALTGSGITLADTIHVPDDYPTIQGAIDASSDGDEIIVAPGTYSEAIDFLGKAIWLHSSDGADVTTIDAAGLDTSVVKCVNGEGSATIIEGFTITGGTGSFVAFEGSGFLSGGGMLNISADPTVRDCMFTDNWSQHGGGMCNHDASPTVLACDITGNSTAWGGGGVANFGDTCTLLMDCSITGNFTEGWGGGMGSWESSPTVANCEFDENDAVGVGGAIALVFGNPLITNCLFAANSASGGGGIADSSDTLSLSNCAFLNNASYGAGGGMMTLWSCAEIVNCTFSANVAIMGGAIYNQESDPSVANSILWGDEGGEIDSDSSSLVVIYCDVQGGYSGEGNIDVDPLFVDPDADELRLSPGSPCIDAADNTAVPADAADLDGNGDTEEPCPLDLDGSPRFHDDEGVDDTGLGTPPIVDMGAYEFQGTSCPADLNEDGVVDILDLSALLAAWGEGDGCPEDLTHDGIVDVLDLWEVLIAWGPCP